MRDFFAAVGNRWPAKTDHYHWLVLPEPRLIRQYIRQYRDAASRPGLAFVRSAWSHITVQHLAPVSQLPWDEVTRITQIVRRQCACIEPFQVTAGPPRIDPGGIICPVGGPRLQDLWDTVVDAGLKITGNRFEVRPDPYIPHLTLAYAYGDVDDERTLRHLAGLPAATLDIPVTKVSLVAQQHDGQEVTWRVIEHIPLGSTR